MRKGTWNRTGGYDWGCRSGKQARAMHRNREGVPQHPRRSR
ncbi:hypothetical protein [Eubacterium ramulus]|nr:hypothetical protein [Eubacterium ramulus]